MIDIEYDLVTIGKAAVESDANNLVFVTREVLTKVYRQGFEDGHRAARHDDFAVRQIERITAEAKESADAT